MIKSILNVVFIFLININLALPQGLINCGASIVITSGANLLLKDANANYTNNISGTNGIINNEGIFLLEGNLINNTTNNIFLNQTNNGSIVFNGTSSIIGNTTNFANLTINGILTGHSSNMNVAGNWTSNGVFNHNNGKVTFNGNSLYTGNSVSTFYNVDIAPGKFLTIEGSNKTMKVQNKIYIKATDPHHMGQLVIADNSSKLTGTGGSDSVFVEVYDTLNNWNYQSMPIYNGNMGAMVLRYFFGKSYNEKSNQYIAITGYDSLQAGRGYALKFNATKLNEAKRLTTFTSPISKLHSGTITYPVTNTSEYGEGWNLVANPYPCSIDWGASQGWNNINIEPTIYMYDAVKKRYTTYNSFTQLSTNDGSRYIPPMQGLFIHCSVDGAWKMDNRVRVAYNQPFLKGEIEKPMPTFSKWISLIVIGNGSTDENIIGFSSDATSGFDRELDAYKLLSSEEIVPQINTKTLDENHVILSVNILPDSLIYNTIIPVDFTVGVAGTFTILAADFSNIDPSVNITLEDIKTNKIVDLRNRDYTFESNTVLNDSRFLLHFGNSALTVVRDKKIIDETQIKIYAYKNMINVQNNMTVEKGLIQVFDLQGKEIALKHLESNTLNQIEINITEGIYVVKVIADNNIITKKIYIRKYALQKKISNPDIEITKDLIDFIEDNSIKENK